MRAITYLWVIVWCGLAMAQGSLEVIDLRHRSAEQVLPTLRPLLEPGGVLTGRRSQLIVRTSAQNLAEIRRALDTLDTPARRLVISVRFDDAAVASRDSIDISGRISNRGSSLDARIAGSRSSGVDRVDQRIQVLEGSRATIATGTSRPLPHRDGVAIQEIATGFDVVPRVSGNTVFLDIEPRREAAGTVAHGNLWIQRATSSVSARLGEWFELAAASGAGARDARGVLSGSQLGAGDNRRIWIRVDEVRP